MMEKKRTDSPTSKISTVLAQGGEGIAVGLSTKILPHNFIELINKLDQAPQRKAIWSYI